MTAILRPFFSNINHFKTNSFRSCSLSSVYKTDVQLNRNITKVRFDERFSDGEKRIPNDYWWKSPTP